MNCKCNLKKMMEIGKETEDGKVVSTAYWCRHCGRICVVATSGEKKWMEPDLALWEVVM